MGRLADKKVLVVNVYGPHLKHDRCQFLVKLYRTLEDHADSCDVIILGGDFNIVPHPIWDKQGGNTRVHRSQLVLHELMHKQGLVDIAREQQPFAKLFTWSQQKPPVFCRLDYFLVSDTCREFVKAVNILPTVYTDHKCVELVMQVKAGETTRNL